MHLDRMEIKSLTLPCVTQIIRVMTDPAGGKVQAVEDLVADACMTVETAQCAKRRARKINVAPHTNLVTEQRDDKGRYSLAAIDDEPVMVPDPKGFWMPAKELTDMIARLADMLANEHPDSRLAKEAYQLLAKLEKDDVE